VPNLTTPDGFTIDHCRSCAATIIWASTRGGKSMPVDADPSADGNVEVQRFPDNTVFADVLTQPPLAGGTTLRKAHFATCPDAANWRARG
jgi:hypothetical protein